MIYLEYNIADGTTVYSQAIELNVQTIHEAAQLFLAFQAGLGFATHLTATLTSVGTAKRRGIEYKRWSGL